MGESARAAKCVVLASRMRAGVRALVGALPADLLAAPGISKVRARLAEHVEPRARQPRELAVLESELRELADLAGRLVAECWPHVEAGGRLDAATERVRMSVSQARCLVDKRRTSMPPPMPKDGNK